MRSCEYTQSSNDVCWFYCYVPAHCSEIQITKKEANLQHHHHHHHHGHIDPYVTILARNRTGNRRQAVCLEPTAFICPLAWTASDDRLCVVHAHHGIQITLDQLSAELRDLVAHPHSAHDVCKAPLKCLTEANQKKAIRFIVEQGADVGQG